MIRARLATRLRERLRVIERVPCRHRCVQNIAAPPAGARLGGELCRKHGAGVAEDEGGERSAYRKRCPEAQPHAPGLEHAPRHGGRHDPAQALPRRHTTK